jgi:hypothetical protein
MTKRAYLYAVFFILVQLPLKAQEVVTGLQVNPAVAARKASPVPKGLKADPVNLPFFDDFSSVSVVPDPLKWIDDQAFINNTYSIKQITTGMATLDAIDSKGNLYETSTPSGFRADQLTSAPVNLGNPAATNIWLSFLYEPGGLSDLPEPADSLTLQFFAPGENAWYSVWRTPGHSADGFRNVIIPVNHPRYLVNGFQFRFVNYASLGSNLTDPSMVGNCDIWNIDYVLLNANRNAADTIYPDVAFRLPVRSLLNTHEAMPWKQFKQAYLQEMGSSIRVHYRNNDDIVRNVTRDFRIHDVYRNLSVHSFSAGATNIGPFTDVDFNASLIYTFESPEPDSALFRVTSSLRTDLFDPKKNDTTIYYQEFNNYFAFDDGSSEGGYGINGLGSRNAMFAYRFNSYVADTVRAVRICFNDSYQDANRRAFDLMVWGDNNGQPGNLLFSREEVMVESGTRINGFYTYLIPHGVEVNGVFYVGWKQRSETFLNAGFDVNTPHKGRQQFWLNGVWAESQVSGSVMIRPVLGLPLITGVEKNPSEIHSKVKIWPNPAGNYIRIGITEHPYSSSAYISIFDLAGHELMKVPFAEEIDISRLNKGIYMVITVINGKRIGFNRLIKSY